MLGKAVRWLSYLFPLTYYVPAHLGRIAAIGTPHAVLLST
jgi:hypothetical protein